MYRTAAKTPSQSPPVPPPPLSPSPPPKPAVSHRYLLRWNSGQQEESGKLAHEGLVTGGLGGQGESRFVFALGPKHHAMENSLSIMM